MFAKLRTLLGGTTRLGDVVTVLDGPYAGKSGTVTELNGQQFTVFIDECCQPKMTAASLRRVRSGGGPRDRRSLEPGEPEPGLDEEHEVARARINQLPPPNL